MQWKSCAPVGEYLNSLLTLPESLQPPQPHQPPQLGNAPDVCSDDQDAAMNHMISAEEEILAYKQLERAVLGNGDHDDGESGSGISSDFNDQAVDDMILEVRMNTRFKHSDANLVVRNKRSYSKFNLSFVLFILIWQLSAELQKDSDSPFPPPEPPQTHQPHQLGDAPDVHSGEFSNCPSPTNYDNESVINIVHNSQNRAANERIPEVMMNFLLYELNTVH